MPRKVSYGVDYGEDYDDIYDDYDYDSDVEVDGEWKILSISFSPCHRFIIHLHLFFFL